MSDNLSTSQEPEVLAESHREGSSWMLFWLILTLLAAFGVAGAYLEKRLDSLENKVIAQTESVSNMALNEIRNSQKEILNNRAEAAAFAKTFSSTMQDVSGMLTESVQAFSQQTQQLSSAIDQNEKSQSELLKTKLESLGILTKEHSSDIQGAIESLAKEVASTRTALAAGQTRSDRLDLQIAALTKKVGDMNENMKAGFISLSELAKEQQAVIVNHVSQKSETLSDKLAALQKASDSSMQEVQSKIAAIGTSVESTSGKTQGLTNSVSNIDERLASLADRVETGLAAQTEKSDMMHTDLTEMMYDLDNRTEDLLIELASAKKELSFNQDSAKSQVKQQLEALVLSVESMKGSVNPDLLTQQFDGLSKNLADSLAKTQAEVEAIQGLISRLTQRLAQENNIVEEAVAAEDDESKSLSMSTTTITEEVTNSPIMDVVWNDSVDWDDFNWSAATSSKTFEEVSLSGQTNADTFGQAAVVSTKVYSETETN